MKLEELTSEDQIKLGTSDTRFAFLYFKWQMANRDLVGWLTVDLGYSTM